MNDILAIRARRIFDGERVLGAGMVLVADGRIAAVDFSGASAPEGAEVVELNKDATLLPGLIDSHTHLALDATRNALSNVAAADEATLLRQMECAAALALRSGVTTVRDLGDRGYLSVELAQRARQETGAPLPDIVAAGPPVTIPGGHFAALGGEAAGARALRAAVRARAEHGCQFVKVMASGGNLTPNSRPHESQYSLQDLCLIVDEAHRLGLRTAAHAHAKSAIVDALDAGFDTLEHVTFFTADGVDSDPAIIERIAARGTFVSLTVGNIPGATEPPTAVAQRMPLMLENGRRLCRSGAPIVLGPDGGIAPGKPHNVLPFAVEALVRQLQMRPVDALRSVTSVASAACGLEGRKGCIVAGADADLVVVSSDPFADIGAIHHVAMVMRQGRFAVRHTPDAVTARHD